MPRKLIIYCDESVSSGRYYSNFYGGLVVDSLLHGSVEDRLNDAVNAMGLRSEVKWTSITESLAPRYIRLVHSIFDEAEKGTIKLRMMFTQNRHVPILTPEQRATSYHRLYYQFIKWGIGLQQIDRTGGPVQVHLRLDKLPQNKEQVAQFKSFLESLTQNPEFRAAHIELKRSWIEEIDSSKHVLAQATDLILGSIAFRLNRHHRDIAPGAARRGRRTRAKESVYDVVNERIRRLYPNFNIGISTGHRGDLTNRWHDPYRHWLLVPRNRQ